MRAGILHNAEILVFDARSVRRLLGGAALPEHPRDLTPALLERHTAHNVILHQGPPYFARNWGDPGENAGGRADQIRLGTDASTPEDRTLEGLVAESYVPAPAPWIDGNLFFSVRVSDTLLLVQWVPEGAGNGATYKEAGVFVRDARVIDSTWDLSTLGSADRFCINRFTFPDVAKTADVILAASVSFKLDPACSDATWTPYGLKWGIQQMIQPFSSDQDRIALGTSAAAPSDPNKLASETFSKIVSPKATVAGAQTALIARSTLSFSVTFAEYSGAAVAEYGFGTQDGTSNYYYRYLLDTPIAPTSNQSIQCTDRLDFFDALQPRVSRVFGTQSQDASGTDPWNDLANVESDNGLTATCTLETTDETSNVARLSGAGFPAGLGAPTGIGVRIARFDSDGSNQVQDVEIALSKDTGSTATGTNKADTGTGWPTSETEKSYGGAGDLWGTTWTEAEMTASSFSLRIQVKIPGETNGTAEIDYVVVDYYFDPDNCS